MRLDRLLAAVGLGSRREVDAIVRRGRVTVDGIVERDGGRKVDPAAAIAVDGELVRYRAHHHRLVNKPAGTVTSTVDRDGPSVLGVLADADRGRSWMPVGRLDVDTTGLLFLTTDGELAHRLTHPKWKVDKVYRARLSEAVTAEDVAAFAAGVALHDGDALPAVLEWTDDPLDVTVTLREGRFHQVKRMFAARANRVVALERVRFGPLAIDGIAAGGARELTTEEQAALYAAVGLAPAT
jgi:16S rRNA pseudouridine516 synthase